jgi:plasmid maintenance system antidote protein VapI
MDNLKAHLTPEVVKLLNISAVEHAAGMSRNTLTHFIKGRRGLSDDQIERVLSVLKSLSPTPFEKADK